MRFCTSAKVSAPLSSAPTCASRLSPSRMPAPRPYLNWLPWATPPYVSDDWISGPPAADHTSRSATRPPRMSCGKPRTSPVLTNAYLAPVGAQT